MYTRIWSVFSQAPREEPLGFRNSSAYKQYSGEQGIWHDPPCYGRPSELQWPAPHESSPVAAHSGTRHNMVASRPSGTPPLFPADGCKDQYAVAPAVALDNSRWNPLLLPHCRLACLEAAWFREVCWRVSAENLRLRGTLYHPTSTVAVTRRRLGGTWEAGKSSAAYIMHGARSQAPPARRYRQMG